MNAKAGKFLLAALLLFGAGVGSAWADGHVHWGVGIQVGPGWYGGWPGWHRPWFYPPPYPPYYYYPAPTVVVQQPPVYVEQPAPEVAPPAAASNDWYYCAASRGYYPYVKECPAGWQRVPAQPPR